MSEQTQDKQIPLDEALQAIQIVFSIINSASYPTARFEQVTHALALISEIGNTIDKQLKDSKEPTASPQVDPPVTAA